MVKIILKNLLLLVMIVISGLVSSLTNGCAEKSTIKCAYYEDKTGISFPTNLGHLKFSKTTDYNKITNTTTLGVSVRYVGEPPIRADIYIYDDGKKNLGTGTNSF